MAGPALSPVAALVRRADPDRFLCALFAPPARREALFLLLALNHELARAHEAASQPLLAAIRLQWWRDAVEEAERGAPPRRHEVAGPLSEALRSGTIRAEAARALIEGREGEGAWPPSDAAALRAHLRATAGALARESGRLLGAPEGFEAPLEEAGAAYGAAGVLRSLPALAGQGRNPLPADRLAAEGLPTQAPPELRNPAVARIGREVAGEAVSRLEAARAGLRGLPRHALAAALPAALAARDLRRILSPAWSPAAPPGPRGAGDRLAVAWAGWRGRL